MVYFNFGKHYQGYNKAMGKYIYNKSHYEEEMKNGGYVSYDEAQEIVAAKKAQKKQYTTSKTAHEILEACKSSTDKKGNVRMPDRAVDALKDMGMKFDRSLPEKYRNIEQGGFE